MWRVAIADTTGGSGQESVWSSEKEVEMVGVVDSIDGLRELLSEQEIDVVDIASTVTAPEKWIQLAADAKKHVICDADGQIGFESIRELEAVCAKQSTLLLMANTLRFSPEYVQAREHILQGAIGKPGVIRMRRSTPVTAKGCIFDILGTDVFDWLRWTFGDVSRVMARLVEHTDEAGQGIQYALVVLRHVDGTIAHVELSWTEEERSSFELTGDSGMMQHDSHESQPILWQMSGKQPQTEYGINRLADVAHSDRLRSRRAHFIRVLSKQETLRMAPEDVFHARKIAQAARQSSESGQPVQLIDGGSSR
ncbi:Gfo/Idh/MocA family protein [Brevibacillus choshinensis]|uniref:Gfo/Idh/MocA family oxidoreductase n=1 Tax=Brevibacillus choshinensis TaxID=54911 RepID=A0ABX7FWB6_BRECH|nr:Gfo/Idh/MocA family oxidoreductase [Brevibacillus choshinensis]QRG70190.1 Gfo/Idh/MocA family oxidoreductase [Brevibacillus choshinensis]